MPKRWKLDLKNIFTGIMIGILIHGFSFANKWPNWDDLTATWSWANMSVSGRWMLQIAAFFSGPLSMPWVAGFLTVVYIVLAANLIIKLFDINRRMIQFAVQAIMLSFPVVGATMFYNMHVDAYFFGMLLMCCGVFCVVKMRSLLGMILGGGIIMLSLGCYQAYLALGAALVIVFLIWKIVYCKMSNRELFVNIAYNLGAFVIGVGGYIFVTKIITNRQGLGSYQGIDKMGTINIANIPNQVIMAYKTFLGKGVAGTGFMFPLIIVLGILTFILLLCNIRQRKIDGLKCIFVLLLLIIFPLACCLICFMGADYIHTLMLYGLIGVFILSLVVFDKGAKDVKYVVECGMLVTAVIVWIYFIETNMAYFGAHVAYEQTYAYANRLLTKIELHEGYTPEDTVWFIGTPDWNVADMEAEWLGEPLFKTFTGCPVNMVQNPRLRTICQTYLGFQHEINFIIFDNSNVEKDVEIEYINLVRDIPVYPNEGSIIRTDDGDIIVKFSEVKR